MKKFFAIFFILILANGLFFIFTPFAQAEEGEERTPSDFELQGAAFAGRAGYSEKPEDPRVIASTVISFALSILGTLLLAHLVYGGFLIMTGGGNEERVTKGRKTITTSVIGLAIIMAAYGITRLIFVIATGDAERDVDSNYEVEVRPDNSVLPDQEYEVRNPCWWIFCG